jgi:hypothetical protein
VSSINNYYRYQYQSKPVSYASNKYKVSAANMHSVASVVRSFFSDSWQNDTNYFANKFQNHDPAIAFHRFYHYQHSGFCQYVKALPGFDEFIESLGGELQGGSRLSSKFSNQATRQKCMGALRQMHKNVKRKKLHVKGIYKLKEKEIIRLPRKQVIEIPNNWEKLKQTKPDKIMIT